MKGHQLLDKVQQPSGNRRQLPSQKCEKHSGNFIDVYCTDHDVVGCSTCFAVEHRNCRGIKFVPDVAQGFSKSKSNAISKELQNLEANIEALQSRLVVLKQRKDKDLEYLKQEKDIIKKEILAVRTKINDHLNQLEQKLFHELDIKYEEVKRQSIDDDIEEIDNSLEDLNRSKQQLQKEGNDSELFVLLETGKANLQKNNKFANKIEVSTKRKRLELKVDRRLQSVTDITCMGRVGDISTQISASFRGKYNIQATTDKECCQVNGICFTSDDEIIITDKGNRRLKKLDSKYKVTSYIDVPGSPCSICQIDQRRLAVTLMEQKKVQTVSNMKPMALLSSFRVGDNCRGILHYNGLLYVCCGGSKINQDEGPGHLEVYSTKGVLLRSIYESMETPTRVEVSADGGAIFIYDAYNGLVLIDRNGNITSHHRYSQLKLSGGMCRLNDDLYCLGGYESDNIVLVTDDGMLHQELLTQKDGIERPLSICYDEKRSRLVVGMNKDIIKVFNLRK